MLSVPLRVVNPIGLRAACQPVTFGVPLAEGVLSDRQPLCLKHDAGRPMPVQTEVLARWPAGSVKWLLVDCVLDVPPGEPFPEQLCLESCSQLPTAAVGVKVERDRNTLLVDTGPATFEIDPPGPELLTGVRSGHTPLSGSPALWTYLTDRRWRRAVPRFERVLVETEGPVRTTVLMEAELPGCHGLRLRARLCFFAGTGLVRLRLTVHNPNRARHRGGLWDLGDPGSFLFRELAVDVNAAAQANRVLWKAETEGPLSPAPGHTLEIYQDSSGGENWQSRNHVNRNGRVPCRFRGYRVQTAEGKSAGRRASPIVVLQGDQAVVAVALPEFWQQFPKALRTDGWCVPIGLFPAQWDDLFELQGGEQKTHTVWVDFRPAAEPTEGVLDWVHRPARILSTPEWYASTGALGRLIPAAKEIDDRLRTLLDGAIRGPKSLPVGREVIDEYGWRNFGDVYADHEDAYYAGPRPVISHYNNQFDVIYGTILAQLRSGDVAWSELFDPLARHVIDIDLYHTTRDRPAYNGGLFWFTDHYLSAETCSHRTYSQVNRPADGSPYGGGPAAQHNFSTGLLHYYYLTGEPEAQRGVLSLADWVMAMDDGSRTLLGLVDDGPTGLASATHEEHYHGPGRGCGNSINTLLDGWLASGCRAYFDKAEALIRRSIHPADNVAARNLLDAEHRWSYTVFLSSLARYLELKIQQGEPDRMFAYAQAGLVHYARWMLENERPYFDHPEELEYPTEAWAAQEFRKANVLRLAARHADEPLRSRLLDGGTELADRAWSDLLRFDTRTAARAVAILMIEGPLDSYWRTAQDEPAPRPSEEYDFGRPEEFATQRQRVLAELKSVRGMIGLGVRLAKPKNFGKMMGLVCRG